MAFVVVSIMRNLTKVSKELGEIWQVFLNYEKLDKGCRGVGGQFAWGSLMAVGLSMGRFVAHVVVWQSFCAVNLKN